MSNSKKKKGNALIAFGIVLMLASVPFFVMASQKSAEAKERAKVNEAAGKIIEESANTKRILGYGSIAVGAVALVFGIVKNKKNEGDA